jgi:hypothetical protein
MREEGNARAGETDEFRSQEAMSVPGFLASEFDRVWTLTSVVKLWPFEASNADSRLFA